MSNNTTHNLDTSESKRCLGCKVPHCKAACPVGNDIPAFLRYVANAEYDKAVELIGHPFGEICGYVCPHDKTCLGGCVLGKKGQAVRMGEVERAVFCRHPYKVERKARVGSKTYGLKVAVVGGGVSGITLAVKMYEQGADVTIFERDELMSTLKLIPSFRLPREAIERIARAIDGKFTVVKGELASDDLTQLQRSFDFVYICTGASALYKLGVDGEEFATPYDEFLKRATHCGDVVVIGGGNTAMDCARLAKRDGANVTVAYRRMRQDMPAFTKEVDDAMREEVNFVYNVAPVRLQRVGGKLQLTLAKTVTEGRGKLTVTDETSVIECDTVVSALGSGFDKGIFGDITLGDEVTNPLPKVYVGGDALGASTVANAVADGIKTAQEMIKDYTKSR